MKLLHIDSSILGDASASRALGQAIVARLRAAHPGLKVVHRDLGASPVPHLSGASLARADAEEAALDDALMAEFLAADIVVLGVPMYNFGIPSQLKAWIDRIAVAGKTFRYTAQGPEGLATGKRLIVAGAYGGAHPAAGGSNFVEPYLRFVFGFMGVTEVEFITAEGLSVSPEQRARALRDAQARIERLQVDLPLAA
jgi:FMN-dependent NADH-azoreductase